MASNELSYNINKVDGVVMNHAIHDQEIHMRHHPSNVSPARQRSAHQCMDVTVGWVAEKRCLFRVLTTYLCDSAPKISWFDMGKEVEWQSGVMHVIQETMVIDTKVVSKLSIASSAHHGLQK